MRLKIVIPIFALGVVLCLIMVLGRNNGASPRVGEPKTQTGVSVVESNASQSVPASTDGAGAIAGATPEQQTNLLASTKDQPGQSEALSPEARHQAYVEKRIDELDDLATEDDSASLNTILSELGNRDSQIRKAALRAAIQFGSRDAIPKLQEAAAQTDDPEEKAELLEAADYLKLPSLTEYLAEKRARSNVVARPSTPKAPRKASRKLAPPPAPAPQ